MQKRRIFCPPLLFPPPCGIIAGMNILLRIFLAVSAAGAISAAQGKNGFDLSGAAIPAAEILQGGPPKDGIPSIDSPVFAAAAEADFIQNGDLILGVFTGGEARAYPINILNWHEIVNDIIGGKPVAVTYCPLCGSGVVFSSEVGGKTLEFGVSGLLYNSDVLLYDRQTHSLWSQLLRRAVSGEYSGENLAVLPVQHTTWRDWREQYPDTKILLPPEDSGRDYSANPYRGYDKSAALYFPVSPEAPGEFHPKEWVLGARAGGETKAYPFSELQKNGAKKVADVVGGTKIVITWNEKERTARAEFPDGGGESVRAFWFAWFAFNPKSAVFRAAS